MPHLHLPATHSEEDLAVAGALATVLESEDLYVAWSVKAGPSAPVIPASIQTPPEPGEKPRPRSRLGQFLQRRRRAR